MKLIITLNNQLITILNYPQEVEQLKNVIELINGMGVGE